MGIATEKDGGYPTHLIKNYTTALNSLRNLIY